MLFGILFVRVWGIWLLGVSTGSKHRDRPLHHERVLEKQSRETVSAMLQEGAFNTATKIVLGAVDLPVVFKVPQLFYCF